MKKRNHKATRPLLKKAVNQPAKVTIHKMPTGVRGLDTPIAIHALKDAIARAPQTRAA